MSWGLIFYGFVDGIEYVERFRVEVEVFFRENGDGGEVFVMKVDNRGMVVLDG